MHRIDCEDGVEALVRKRQAGRITDLQAAHDLRLAVPDGVLGNVDTEGFQARADLHQVLYQESLATPHVEDAVARLQPEVPDDVLGDRNPAAVIAVAAVALLAGPIEVFLAELECDATVLFLVRHARLHVALGLRIAGEQVDLGHQAPARLSLWHRATPSSSVMKR